MLAGFVGFAVISKIPKTLHTPLMSGTNAIHGIVLLGGLIVIGLAGNGVFNKVLLVIAIAFGTINIVGGFLVTDRMLEMFKRKPQPAPKDGSRSDPVATSFVQQRELPPRPLHRRVRALHLRADAGSPARGPPCAATASPRWAWRSRSSRRCCCRGERDWGLIVIGIAHRQRRSASPRRAKCG